MEGLNWVKKDCSVIRYDAIHDNQTLCKGFILRSQQVFQNLPALLKAHEISILPSMKSELILLFLCISYHCSTSSASSVSRTSISSCWEFTLMNSLVLLSPSLYVSPGLHVRLSTSRKDQPSELRSLFVGKHTLCCQGLCTTESESQVYCYYSSAFSSLYFLRYSILSDLLSHLYNTRPNKRLSSQEDRFF